MTETNLLTWLDAQEMRPIALLAWAGGYEDRGTILTRDAARIREICGTVFTPSAFHLRAKFPDRIEGIRLWTVDEVIEVSNNDDGHTFEVLARNPPEELDRDWGPCA